MFERYWVLFLIIPYECKWCISLILELITRLTVFIPSKVWLKTRLSLAHLRGFTAHMSPQAISGDMELSCCSGGVAGSSTALPAAGPFLGLTTSQTPHQVPHSQ